MDKLPLQFAVVREDPNVEAKVVSQCLASPKVLLVASGGCTAFHLATLYPHIEITLFDKNATQLEHVKKKLWKLKHETNTEKIKKTFNIENADPSGLNACGNFESLFRSFSFFLQEFVLEKRDIFDHVEIEKNPYWAVAFELYFHRSLLLAMFGERAIQYGGISYSSYFRNRLEEALKAPSRDENYFLHHLFFGFYRMSALPLYLTKKLSGSLFQEKSFHFNFLHSSLENIPDLDTYDVISLSNIWDWAIEEEIFHMASLLNSQCKKGSHLIFRQLNHIKDYHSFLPAFLFQKGKEEMFLKTEKSFFYNKMNYGIKI